MTLQEAGVVREPRPVPNTSESVFAQLSMKGKVVAITGAADGIGFAVAEAVAEAGANVAMWYNSNDVAVAKAKQLEDQYHIKAKAYKVEVSDHQAVEKAMSDVVGDFGKLDVFIANAGMAISKAVTEQTVEEYKKQMSVNGECTFCLRTLAPSLTHSLVDGVFYCAKYAGAIFKSQGFGNLIITSSISAHIVNVPVDQPVCTCKRDQRLHLLTQTGLQLHKSCSQPSRKELGSGMARVCKGQRSLTWLFQHQNGRWPRRCQ